MTRYLQHALRKVLKLLIATTATMTCFFVTAQTTFEDLFQVAKSLNDDAIASQAQIDELEDQRAANLNEYRNVLKQIDGQKVYNRQIQLIVNKQLDTIAQLKRSIEEVTSIQREIVPLMLRMIVGLEQFIELDMPFDIEKRRDRIDKLHELMDDPNVSISEKFSQVLRAYQIESEYGRTMDAQRQEIPLNGQSRNVDILRVGRVALVFQSIDGDETGWFNRESNQWELLDDSYTIPIRNGLKMARKQLTSGLFRVPIVAPEA